jgi:hypothetical protein
MVVWMVKYVVVWMVALKDDEVVALMAVLMGFSVAVLWAA